MIVQACDVPNAEKEPLLARIRRFGGNFGPTNATRRGATGPSASGCDSPTLVDDLVDQAIFGRFCGRHVVVAFRVARDAVQRLAGALGQDLVQLLAGLENLARLDLDLGRLTAAATRRLVDH